MFKELRYLLHGNKDKYNDVQTPLYVTTQESTLWWKVGLQVLERECDTWRLLNSALVEHIPSSKFHQLGIQSLQPEQVVDLIRESGAECVDGSLLDRCERYELLGYLSQKPLNEDLWKSLRLHEATVGDRLERIAPGRVYLDNSDFPLDERLKNHVVLIRQNREIQQNWIPLWTPDAVIAKILSLPQPYEYCDLILDALQRMSDEERKSRKEDLQNAGWLPNGYRPQDVFWLKGDLATHIQAIASLHREKYPENDLPQSVRDHQAYPWVRGLFTSWSAGIVIKKVLAHPQKAPDYWRRFSPVVLDALPTDIPDDLKKSLAKESWLFFDNHARSPETVIKIVPGLQSHLSTLVDLSSDKYAKPSQLPLEIANHRNSKILHDFFSKWCENDVLEFVLKQREPHKHYEIILDALSSLLPARTPNEENIQKLKTTAWLVDKQGNAVYPQNVLHYPDLKEDLEELLLLTHSSYVSSSQLAKQSVDCDVWLWLTENFFATQGKALVKVGELLINAPE